MTRRGFTLIELLAAVFISSIVVSAAYTLMTSSTQNFDDESQRRMLKSNIRIAELLIQRDIARTGYMAPFDTKAEDDSERLWLPSDMTNVEMLAFSYHQSNDPNLAKFSGFTFVASLSDFLEFQIERRDGERLCINPSLTMPLTASDIGNLGSNANPVAQNADEAEFEAAFRRTFTSDIQAISIQSPTGTYITAPIQGVTIEPTDVSCSFAIHLPNADMSPPSVEGFDTLEGSNVFPVKAVSYFVAQDSSIPGRTDLGRNNLMRCVNNPLESQTDVQQLIADNNCEVLISNIEYFEIFPLINDNNVSNAFFNRYQNDGSILNNAYNIQTQHNTWNNVKMHQLRGVYFRLGAMTDTPARSVQNIFNNNENYPSYVNKGDNTNPKIFPLEHLQGIAPFRLVPPSDASSLVVVQN